MVCVVWLRLELFRGKYRPGNEELMPLARRCYMDRHSNSLEQRIQWRGLFHVGEDAEYVSD